MARVTPIEFISAPGKWRKMLPMQARSIEANWAGNYTFKAERIHRPATVEEVQEIVARAHRVRVVGARHSFHGIADSPELISLEALPGEVTVDHGAGTASCSAGMTYAQLVKELAAENVALHNLASLPQVTVAGAIATGTHGSGDGNGNLATAVAGLELVTSSGEIVRCARGDPDFPGMVVGLGALGAVTRVTLEVEPAYAIRQRVYEGLPWATLLDRFDEIAACGYSVSVFTRWEDTADQLWVKSRVDVAEADPPAAELFGAIPATEELHPIRGADPVVCTSQLGRTGPWWDRLFHFRPDSTLSPGDQLQAEYMVPRQHAVAALQAVYRLAGRIRPLLLVSEIRTVAADSLWMSPQTGTDVVAIHFSWCLEQEAVDNLLVDLEAALAPFAARPHWGKRFHAGGSAIAALYERLPDFADLVARLDPRGAFRNRWLEEHALGET